jgi:hypothetical protein
MAPTSVRMLLVEGENADGATVDEDNFVVADGEDPATFSAPQQVVAAILGTREGANEAGYQLLSTGVTWSDDHEAAALRDVLATHKVENVMLVSSFLAAAALAQSMGSATGYAHAALLYIEPDSATLAVVDTADGSITDVHRELLPDDDDQAVAKLLGLVSAAEELDERPEGLLVLGTGVDLPLIKPAIEGATSLPLSVPDLSDAALARGAALASARPPVSVSSTDALAYAQDPGTGSVNPHALEPSYLAAAGEAAGAEPGALAYSAVTDDSAAVYTQEGPDAYADEEDFTTGMYPDFSRIQVEKPSRTPFLAAMSVLIIFVTGVMALVISLAFSIRPSASSRPSLTHNVVMPARPPAPLPQAQVLPPPAPAPVAAPAPVQALAPAPVRAPAPIRGPGPVPFPAPAPMAPPPFIPPIIPRLLAPPLLGPPGPPPDEGPWGGDRGGWGRGGPGWGHGGGGWGHGGFGPGFGGHRGGGFGGHGRW